MAVCEIVLCLPVYALKEFVFCLIRLRLGVVIFLRALILEIRRTTWMFLAVYWVVFAYLADSNPSR